MLLSCTLALGCAEVGRQVELSASPAAGYGVVLLGVDTQRKVDKLDLCSDAGCVDAGSFANALDVRAVELLPDEYCVTRLTALPDGPAGVRILEMHEDRLCFDVRAGERKHVGHVVIRELPTQTARTPVSIRLLPRAEYLRMQQQGASGAPSPAPAASPRPTPPTRAAAPAEPRKLTADELLVGIGRMREPAENCAREVGLSDGDTFTIAFTIDGRSGAVIVAELVEEQLPERLEVCVRRVTSAQGPGLFPSSEVEEQRFQYKFRV